MAQIVVDQIALNRGLIVAAVSMTLLKNALTEQGRTSIIGASREERMRDVVAEELEHRDTTTDG